MTSRAMGILVKSGNKFWAVKRSKKDKLFGGMWGLPGGHIKKGESLEAASKREFLEETGLNLAYVENSPCLKGYISIKGGAPLMITLHRGKIMGGKIKPSDEDIERVKLISRDKLIKSLSSKGYPEKEILKIDQLLKSEGLN